MWTAALLVATSAFVGTGDDVAAGPPPVRIVAEGLNGPFGLQFGGGRLYVAESDAGQVIRVNHRTGRTRVVTDELQSPSGVARVGTAIVVVTGESFDPSAEGGSSVYRVRKGRVKLLADLLEYELANNPDGQRQFDSAGDPLDALSNPFAVIKQRARQRVLVADAGANAVLSVDRRGEVSTFFVPPVVTTGSCRGRPNNDRQHRGCDPVPTGLAYGPHNTLYVSTLSGEAPRQGRVYILNARSGDVLDVISGLTAPTGVAVAPDGTVYASELLHGAPEGDGPPPPGFDPSEVGRIVRIAVDGTRTYADVTMPVGLDWHGGKLYSTAWSIAGFLGIADAGQVVAVRQSAFS